LDEEEASMKLYRNAIVLVLVLAVLGGVYYFISTNKKNEEKKDDTVTIFETEKDKISEINIVTQGSNLVFYKDGDTWKEKTSGNVKLVQSKIDSLVYDVSNIKAEQVVEEKAKDLNQYGLETPKSTVNVKLTDGKIKTFYVGDQTPSKTAYYFKDKDKEAVYTIYSSKGETLSSSLENFRDRTLVALKPEEITSFTIEGKNRERIVVKAKTETTNDQTGALSTWDVIEPYKKDGDNQNINEMVLSKLPEITVKDFVEDKPDDLGKYGLSSPSYVIQVTDKNNNSVKLLLGDSKDDAIYLKVEGSDPVYTVDAKKLEFKDVTAFMLAEKFAYIVNIDKVDKFVINHEGRQSTFEIIRKGDKTEYKVNGKEASEDLFKKFYQEVIGLTVDGVNVQKVEGTPAVSYTFYHNGGIEDVKMEYVSMDDRNYAVFKNGKSEFYIKKKKVEKMLEALKNFEQNPVKKE
jgi:hypothetical protein